MDVRHHGRIAHAKTPIEPTTAPSVCQHGEKSVLVNVVVPFAQTFRAILVGGTKTVVGFAAQTDESVSVPFYFEQPGVRLSKALRVKQHDSVAIHVRPAIRVWT